MAKMSPLVPPPGTVSRTPAVVLDSIDRRILDLLSADGRASVREVAERARIGRATAYTRIQRLQDAGVIRGFTVVLDPRRAGVGLAAYVYVKIDQHAWRTLGHVVARLPEDQDVCYGLTARREGPGARSIDGDAYSLAAGVRGHRTDRHCAAAGGAANCQRLVAVVGRVGL